MRYDAFSYLWPPRPEKAITADLIGFYEKRGWVAQHKLNGTCNVLAVAPDRRIVAMNRHNETHKLWTPTPASSRVFQKLPGKGWYVFTTELMHSKVPGIKDTNFIHDVLVADGAYLVGTAFSARQDMLRALFKPSGECDSHYVIDENTWLAKTHTSGFRKLYDGMERPEHEGIVMKNPAAALALCSRESANAGWQVKSRRPHKNYGF